MEVCRRQCELRHEIQQRNSPVARAHRGLEARDRPIGPEVDGLAAGGSDDIRSLRRAQLHILTVHVDAHALVRPSAQDEATGLSRDRQTVDVGEQRVRTPGIDLGYQPVRVHLELRKRAVFAVPDFGRTSHRSRIRLKLGFAASVIRDLGLEPLPCGRPVLVVDRRDLFHGRRRRLRLLSWGHASTLERAVESLRAEVVGMDLYGDFPITRQALGAPRHSLRLSKKPSRRLRNLGRAAQQLPTDCPMTPFLSCQGRLKGGPLAPVEKWATPGLRACARPGGRGGA